MFDFLFSHFMVFPSERALLFKRGKLIRILNVGQVKVFDPLRTYSIEYFPAQGSAIRVRIARCRRLEAEPSIEINNRGVLRYG